jgi:hypothetical protein
MMRFVMGVLAQAGRYRDAPLLQPADKYRDQSKCDCALTWEALFIWASGSGERATNASFDIHNRLRQTAFLSALRKDVSGPTAHPGFDMCAGVSAALSGVTEVMDGILGADKEHGS